MSMLNSPQYTLQGSEMHTVRVGRATVCPAPTTTDGVEMLTFRSANFAFAAPEIMFTISPSASAKSGLVIGMSDPANFPITTFATGAGKLSTTDPTTSPDIPMIPEMSYRGSVSVTCGVPSVTSIWIIVENTERTASMNGLM